MAGKGRDKKMEMSTTDSTPEEVSPFRGIILMGKACTYLAYPKDASPIEGSENYSIATPEGETFRVPSPDTWVANTRYKPEN